MFKCRPERKRPKDECEIVFADIDTQQRAQGVLNSNNISFRAAGNSLYVSEGQERLALAVLVKAGANPIKPVVLQES
jgi:hypothetical protein